MPSKLYALFTEGSDPGRWITITLQVRPGVIKLFCLRAKFLLEIALRVANFFGFFFLKEGHKKC